MVTNSEHLREARKDTAPVVERAVSPLNKVSWGAVFAGVVLALAVQLVLNLLGVGIGASTIDPDTGGTPSAASISIGAALWWTISGIIAAFAGGFVASRLSGRPSRSTGGWHGLTAWAFSILIVFYVLYTAVGNMAGTAYTTITGAASGIVGATSGAVQNIEPAAGEPGIWERVQGMVSDELDQMMGDLQTEEVRQAVMDVVAASFSGDENATEAAREEAITAISEAQGISRSEATQQLDQYVQQASSAVDTVTERATETADVVADRISQTAWFSAIALILGALAAWFGGMAGTPRRHAV